MKVYRLEMHQEFNAPIEKVWEAFSDHYSFAKMMGQKMTRVVDSTDPTNVNGVNSVRKIHVPLISFEETIRKSEKPTRIEYQITKGSPFAHHYGTMVFKSLPGRKSAIDYRIELGSNVPGWAWLIKQVLRVAVEGGMRRYAREL
jgi:uncharacterized protein YndB with AHSA1/START domain